MKKRLPVRAALAKMEPASGSTCSMVPIYHETMSPRVPNYRRRAQNGRSGSSTTANPSPPFT